jgi:hypothetical protein
VYSGVKNFVLRNKNQRPMPGGSVWDMPDEYVWAVIKALAIVFCGTMIVLSLAWVAIKKCFQDDNIAQREDQPAENPKTKRRWLRKHPPRVWPRQG